MRRWQGNAPKSESIVPAISQLKQSAARRRTDVQAAEQKEATLITNPETADSLTS
jgi:hypothetical protein